MIQTTPLVCCFPPSSLATTPSYHKAFHEWIVFGVPTEHGGDIANTLLPYSPPCGCIGRFKSTCPWWWNKATWLLGILEGKWIILQRFHHRIKHSCCSLFSTPWASYPEDEANWQIIQVLYEPVICQVASTDEAWSQTLPEKDNSFKIFSLECLRDSTRIKSLPLHVAGPDSIPGTAYGSLNTEWSDP